MLALTIVLVAGCGRVRFASLDGGLDAPATIDPTIDAPGLDAFAPPIDAVGPDVFGADAYADDAFVEPPDAYADDAFGADAYADDVSADDAFVPPPDAAMVLPDAAMPMGPGDLWVTNTLGAGAGSLEAAIATANTCASPPYTIRFAIPRGDSGRVTSGTNAFWRITTLSTTAITCAGTMIDGTTQTSIVGDDNAFRLDLVAGLASTALPRIEGPEIDLRRISLSVSATDVTVRGLAMQSFTAGAARVRVEQCFLGSEPDAATPQLAADRRGDAGWAFYAENCPDCSVASSVIAGANDITGASYNLFSFRTGSLRATVRDSYFVGGIATGTSWDVLYLVDAEDHRVLRNVFEVTGYEYVVEWVPGYGGQIVDNTFFGRLDLPSAISMGGAAMMSGNRFVP